MTAETSASDCIERVLRQRGPNRTICPSEIARFIAGEDWRSHMSEVHAAVDDLVASGRITLSWKGEQLSSREGPYRIAKV